MFAESNEPQKIKYYRVTFLVLYGFADFYDKCRKTKEKMYFFPSFFFFNLSEARRVLVVSLTPSVLSLAKKSQKKKPKTNTLTRGEKASSPCELRQPDLSPETRGADFKPTEQSHKFAL